MTTADSQAVYRLVQQYDGVARAHQMATRYTDKALKAIRKLPADAADTRGELEQLTLRILGRKN